jgi:hypothetical protein
MRTYRILLRNHFYGVRHSVSKLHEQPLIKILLIGGFSIGWLLCLSWLFYEGFDFMYNLGGAGFLLIPRLFTLFFLGLGFMLVLSGAVTGYSNLFQSAEVRRLLTWPVPLKDLFYYKFIQTCWMSSWAFIFIIMPFIGAFGVYRKWPLMMVFWSLAYSIPFVMIFSGLGFLFVLIFIRWAPRGKLLAILGILSLLAIVVWAFGYAERMQQQNAEDMIVLVRMIPGLELASNRILPNWWMSQGILAIARGELGRGMWFLLLLSSSVPVLLFVTAWIGERIFYTGLQVQLAGKGNLSDHPSLLSR